MQGAINYRRDIDGLRAVAVLPVVLCHAGISAVPGGYVGVDVFFVISGFLITSIIARDMAEGQFSLLSFYERRARRILPALTAVVVATLVVGWFVLLPDALLGLGRSAAATVLFVSNIHYSGAVDYFASASEYKPLLHTWSLAVEEQFYLIFPLLLMALTALRRPQWMLPAMAAIAALSLAASALLLDAHPEAVFFLIGFRAWELAAGAIVALLPAPHTHHLQNRLLRETSGIAGLIAIVVPTVLYNAKTPFPGLAAVPPVAGAMILLWIGRRGDGSGSGSLVNSALSAGPLVGIGLISYSLYLWHWPILSFARIIAGSVELPGTVIAGALVGSLVLAWLSWRYIERPFRKPAPTGLGRRAVFVLAALAIAMPAIAGEALRYAGGVPQRLPPDARRIAAAATDRNQDGDRCLRRSIAENPCRLGERRDNTAPADFLVWGDSHAGMLKAGFDMAARETGQSGVLAGMPGCAPLLDIQRRYKLPGCDPYNAAVWLWLKERPDVKTVVLAARWALYVDGSHLGKHISWRWTGTPAGRPASETNEALMTAALAALTDRLVASGRNVVLLGPVPDPGYNVPADSARRRMMGWPLRPAKSRAYHAARDRTTDQILRRVAARSSKISYVPLLDVFCRDAVCPARLPDETPIFHDDNHVTRTAARTLLGPRLATIWQAPAR